MHEAIRSKKLIKRLGFSVCLFLFIVSCAVDDPDDDDDSEGGVIGTGIQIFGTVTDVRQFASNTLQIMSDSGEISNALIDDTGRYSAPSVKGAPPYLIQADLGNDEYRYAISFGEERTNVHSYSDVIMRNWFAANNGDIDSEFEQKRLFTDLPSEAQFESNAEAILSLVSLVLDTYGLTGDQLLTGDYDSGNDPQGIDSYLRANQMLIKDDRIAVVITDPETKVQSTTRSNFSLYDLADEQDIESPQTPMSVRALPSASDEIVIVWEPAIDNRGVVGYEIFRDDALIATTPFPVFTDGGLSANRLYTYYITAIDGAGNTSAPSSPVATDTLGDLDGLAPPAPVQLNINAFPGQMELIWGQADIGDVVSFDVYRGRVSGSLQPLTTVTSTFMTDATISSGVNYCYQVTAVDASGNESARSAEECETAAGEEIRSSNTAAFSQVPALAGLSIPDIESLECTTQWDQYSIVSETTIEPGCYLVDSSIEVRNTGHLNIEPGAVLKFGANTGITVVTGGSLSSIGTADLPVVMTSQDPTPGYWNGVYFQRSNSSRNKLVNTVVEYAGIGTVAAVTMESLNSAITTLEMANNLIRHSSGVGFSSDSEFGNLTTLDGTVIADCDVPVRAHVAMIGRVTQRNDFRNNRNPIIDLGYSVVDKDAQLKDLGVSYSTEGIIVNEGTLTVSKGVEIKFRSASGISVSGSMVVNGTEADRVKFTGVNDERGDWSGIWSDGRVILNNVDIEYAGSSEFWRSNNASIYVYDGYLTLNSVNISNSRAYALNYISGDSLLVSDLLVENNAKSLRIPISKIASFGADSRFSNNDESAITLHDTSNILNDINLIDLGVPYAPEDSLTISDSTLTINEGVQLSMPNNSSINVYGSATLNILGTAERMVSIYNETGIPGSWLGIQLTSTSTLNTIQHASIAFGGGGLSNTPGNIWMDCRYGGLSISDTSLEDSFGWGIGLSGSQICNIDLGENVQFARNNLGGINIEQ